MHVRNRTLRVAFSASRGLDGDRNVVSRHHVDLLDQKHWELSTPSRSLPVLDVLARSGVFVDGLENAASQPLVSMTPFMTSSERSMLQRISSFFSTQRRTHRGRRASAVTSVSTSSNAADSVALGSSAKADPDGPPSLTAPQAEELVHAVYRAACARKPLGALDPAHLGEDFVELLTLPCCLMLLELCVSRSLDAEGMQDIPLEPLLTRVHTLLAWSAANDSRRIEFRAVWWLLTMLEGDPNWFRVRIPDAHGGIIFTCCARLIHNMLPAMSTEQLLLSYLLLTTTHENAAKGSYERPFIVIRETEKVIQATPLRALSEDVSTDTLLHFMMTPFMEKQRSTWPKLCLGWYTTSGRITDMNLSQCKLALHILSRLHVKLGADEALTNAGTRAEWQLLHDSLFAQIFVCASELRLHECVSLLEDIEVIHVSALGVAAPNAVLEKVKGRTFDTLRTVIKRLGPQSRQLLSAQEVAQAYEATLRFEALLQRYALVPCSDRDARIVARCAETLRRRLCQPCVATPSL